MASTMLFLYLLNENPFETTKSTMETTPPTTTTITTTTTGALTQSRRNANNKKFNQQLVEIKFNPIDHELYTITEEEDGENYIAIYNIRNRTEHRYKYKYNTKKLKEKSDDYFDPYDPSNMFMIPFMF